MKILKLTFKNLNSLYGQWSIDFTHPEYTQNGIFALTGPTGAGKSTILDAMCLALYGQTPRLGKITTSGNEIMSRQTYECSSEVEFSSSLGHFRCSWAQHKARNKVDGNLVDATHEISDARTNKIIESKKSLVAAVVEEKTGMDFDRFTRSILLAQGSFDIFLKAGAEEKSKILEQITGTELYTTISKAVFDKHKRENEKLLILKNQLEEINPISPDQEVQLKDLITTYAKREKVLRKTINTLNEGIQWHKGINNIEEELEKYYQELNSITSEIKEFSPKREKLQKAIKATELATPYSELTRLREALSLTKKLIIDTNERITTLSLSEQKKEGEKKAKEAHTQQAKENEIIQREIIKKVRSLDQTIEQQEKTITKEKETHTSLQQLLKLKKSEIETNSLELHKKEEKLKTTEQFLEQHTQDNLLNSALTGIEIQLEHLKESKDNIGHKEAESKSIKASIEEKESILLELKRNYEEKEETFNRLHKTIEEENSNFKFLLNGKILREYYKEVEHLIKEKAYQSKIKELEDERLLLIDNSPCPLCGSLHHPFAEGNIPIKEKIDIEIENITKLIDALEKKQEEITKIEKETETEKEKLATQLQAIQVASSSIEQLKSTKEILDKDIKNLTEEYKKKRKTLESTLSTIGIVELDKEEEELLQTLTNRLKSYMAKVEEKESITKEINSIKQSIREKQLIYTNDQEREKELSSNISFLETTCKGDKDERFTLFLDKDCDIEEKKLYDTIGKAEREEKEIREELTAIKNEIHNLKTAITTEGEKLVKEEKTLATDEKNFITSLASFSFTDEQEFITSRLSLPQREELTHEMKALDERNTTVKANISSRTTSLTKEKGKHITDDSLEELTNRVESFTDELTSVVEEKASINTTLHENEKIKVRGLEKQNEITKVSQVVSKWSRLNNLIGSADGKKYRKFAQGITFELMVDHANGQLNKMSDRYLLLHDTLEPLELHIVDNYQAGEVRSIKNLSGGETFIVSLALALGLSQMSSKKVRVDSLFLDEGFGTLDEEALETALETLSSLQQEGKLIGIISHVSGLKERISTQINVSPINGGKSKIEGPGCKRIEE